MITIQEIKSSLSRSEIIAYNKKIKYISDYALRLEMEELKLLAPNDAKAAAKAFLIQKLFWKRKISNA